MTIGVITKLSISQVTVDIVPFHWTVAFTGVRCKVYFKANPYQKEDDDRTFLTVEQVKMDFSVKDITMGVENDNNNRVIRKFVIVRLIHRH